MDGDVYFSYLVAPYWSDIDTRRAGRVRYETYSRGDSEASDGQISTVEDFLAAEESVTMVGEWMMLVSWEDVHPYPHGTSAELERENPYLDSVRMHWVHVTFYVVHIDINSYNTAEQFLEILLIPIVCLLGA